MLKITYTNINMSTHPDNLQFTNVTSVNFTILNAKELKK